MPLISFVPTWHCLTKMATQPPPGPTGSSKNGDRGIETEGHKSWNGRVATGVYKHEPGPQTDQASLGKKKSLKINQEGLGTCNHIVKPSTPTPADTGSLPKIHSFQNGTTPPLAEIQSQLTNKVSPKINLRREARPGWCAWSTQEPRRSYTPYLLREKHLILYLKGALTLTSGLIRKEDNRGLHVPSPLALP